MIEYEIWIEENAKVKGRTMALVRIVAIYSLLLLSQTLQEKRRLKTKG